jgi:hypothetical protein
MNHAYTGRRGLFRASLCVAAVVTACAATAAFADENPFAGSDNATFVPGTGIVATGNVQVETGLSRTQDGDGTSSLRVWSTPTLLRFGSNTGRYEFRVQTNAYNRVRTYGAVTNGMGDVTAGAKWAVPQNWDKDLSLAVTAQAAFPSGTKTINNRGVRPEVVATAQWQMPNANTFGAVAGAKYDMDQLDNRYKSAQLAANFGHTWNTQWSSYVQGGVRPWVSNRRGGKNVMYGLGTAWRPLPATQLNATVGFGLRDNDTDLQYSVSFARSFHPQLGTWAHNTTKQQDAQPQTPSASSDDGK